MTTNNLNLNYQYIFYPLVFLLVALALFGLYNPRYLLYKTGRQWATVSTMVRTMTLPKIEGANFIVKYYPGDEAEAKIVLEAAEHFVQPVSQKLQYTPKGKVTVIVYPDKEKLNAFFGWPADESAMGVYWAGTIRVLAPGQWIDLKNKEEVQTFLSSGPMAHEYTHLVVDDKTKGNYTRWFTEGVAQYIELELTGFRFLEAAGSLEKNRYSLQELTDNYDRLPNQSLAYRQSLAAVYYLAHYYGEDSVIKIMEQLGQGKSMNESLQTICGTDMMNFEKQLDNWLNKNWKLFS